LGMAGSANYANGTFTVAGAGRDAFRQFGRLPLCLPVANGTGPMVARGKLQGSSAQAES